MDIKSQTKNKFDSTQQKGIVALIKRSLAAKIDIYGWMAGIDEHTEKNSKTGGARWSWQKVPPSKLVALSSSTSNIYESKGRIKHAYIFHLRTCGHYYYSNQLPFSHSSFHFFMSVLLDLLISISTGLACMGALIFILNQSIMHIEQRGFHGCYKLIVKFLIHFLMVQIDWMEQFHI